MDVMGLRRRLASEPIYQVTETGTVIRYDNGVAAPLVITGSGTVVNCGSNMIDDSKRYTSSSSVYVGNAGTGYTIPLRAGTYTFSCEFLNGAHYFAYVREKNASSAQVIWRDTDYSVSSAAFTLEADGLYRFNLYLATGVNKNNVGRCWLNYGSTALPYEAYTGTKSETLTGRRSVNGVNTIWSDTGDITVTYWKDRKEQSKWHLLTTRSANPS